METRQIGTPVVIKGKCTAIVYDEHGNIKQKVENPNLIVTVGRWSVGQKLANSGSDLASLWATTIAIGTGTAGPSLGDTGLGGLVDSKIGVFSQGSNENSWQVVATWTQNEPNANVTLYESGVFFTPNTWLFCRQTFNVTKNTPDTLTIIWQFAVTQA